MIRRILNLPRVYKRLITLIIDSIFVSLAVLASFITRSNEIAVIADSQVWVLIATILPISLLAFIKLGLYHAVMRYMSSQALGAVLLGVTFSTISFVIAALWLDLAVPTSQPLIYGIFCLLFIGGSRITLRALFGRVQVRRKEPVIIYGAGSAGRQLSNALHNSTDYQPVAFIDDDRNLTGTILQGVKVYHSKELEKVIERKAVNKILLAIPSVEAARRKEILLSLEHLAVKVFSIPSVDDIVNGTHQVNEIKEVGIEDLLGRDPVPPVPELMQADITNKVVMVTGAGGSIGSELCRQIFSAKPSALILLEISEYNLYSIEKELRNQITNSGLEIELLPFIGSVQNKNRVNAILERYQVDTLYHAAAYKHVPLVEYNMVEGVENNVFGTLIMAEAAIQHKVDTFVLVSTDKAVRPTNVMGASKRCAETILQAYAQNQSNTRFCMVRFGNVLGSSGSVVPLFRKQIATGGPLTLTHEEITRYFMTIPEAAQLVIQAGAMGQGGDVFVLDMGESVKIKDLAVKLIHLSGLQVKDEDHPYGDIEIKCTGLRPGEKLYEELLIGENVNPTSHARILTANEEFLPLEELKTLLGNLKMACLSHDVQQVREILVDAHLAFTPKSDVVDLYLNNNEVDRSAV